MFLSCFIILYGIIHNDANPRQKVITFALVSNSFQQAKVLPKVNSLLEKNLFWECPNKGTLLFTSRNYFSKNNTLIDLLEHNTEQLYPPIPNQWLIDNHLNFSDPNILSKDNDGDGFSILEEWQGNDPWNSPGKYPTDPNNLYSHPLLWTKLKCTQSSIHRVNYSFDFIGIDTDSLEQTFQLQPKYPIPNITSEGKVVSNRKIISLKLGEKLYGLPLKVTNYVEKSIIHKEIRYNISELTIQNLETKEIWTLIQKSTLHPESTVLTLLEGVTLDYTIGSFTKKICLQIGDTFFLPEMSSLRNKLDSQQGEYYQLIKLSPKEVVLKKENKQYVIPIFIR